MSDDLGKCRDALAYNVKDRKNTLNTHFEILKAFLTHLNSSNEFSNTRCQIIDALTQIIIGIEHFLKCISNLIYNGHQLFERHRNCVDHVLASRRSAHLFSKLIQVQATVFNSLYKVQQCLALIVCITLRFKLFFG